MSPCQALASAGAEIILGTWVPALNIFETSLRRGKFDENRALPNGKLLEFAKARGGGLRPRIAGLAQSLPPSLLPSRHQP